jgi:hypothetical protein
MLQFAVISKALFRSSVNSKINFKAFLKMSTDINDTVVSRCTEKIRELVKPLKLVVTSSNDDPNGSHVSLF